MMAMPALWARFCDIAERRGDRTALSQGDQTISFRALRTRAEACSLCAEPGDAVIISDDNSADYIIKILATWRAGAIPFLIHPDFASRYFQDIVTRADAAAVFAPKRGYEPLLPETRKQERQVARPQAAPIGSVIFTSGSTGPPKGVMQRAETLIERADAIGKALGLDANSGDRILCPIPFSFDYGFGQLLSLVLCGIPLVLPTHTTAASICDAIETHAPTVFASVPVVMADLCFGLSRLAEIDTASIRLITNTGSVIPNTFFDAMRRYFPSAKLSLNYGLTETYRSTMLPMDLCETHRDSVGYAAPGVRIIVVGEDDQPAPPGQPGDILHVGAGTFHGYWKDEATTARVKTIWKGQDAVRTGDVGCLDESGLLRLKGRRDRQVKVMGVRISLEEVEVVLRRCALVQDVAVTSQPHDMFGAMIIAHVVPQDRDMDDKTLRRRMLAYAREAFDRFHQPRQIKRRDRFPRTTSGKVDYSSLRSDREATCDNDR